MDIRRELNKKIERKRLEIAEWTRDKNEREALIREAHAYIAGLTDTLKLLPKENPSNAGMALRPGSEVAKARQAILNASMGKPLNHNNKASLSGSLATYVRKNVIFTRPAPNTFGLMELEQDSPQEPLFEEEPPANFGSMNGAETKNEKTEKQEHAQR
jgi:hypothetical protein